MLPLGAGQVLQAAARVEQVYTCHRGCRSACLAGRRQSTQAGPGGGNLLAARTAAPSATTFATVTEASVSALTI